MKLNVINVEYSQSQVIGTNVQFALIMMSAKIARASKIMIMLLSKLDLETKSLREQVIQLLKMQEMEWQNVQVLSKAELPQF